MEKKDRIQTFDYEGKRITFDFGDGNEMINATEIAKVFGKKLDNFSRLKQTKDFIQALEKSMNSTVPSHVREREKAIKVVRGGNQLNLQGTWYEQRLALKLAAWLSPDFEVWIYSKIRELITTGRAELDSNQNLSKGINIKSLEFVFQKIKDNAMEIHYLSDIIEDLKKSEEEED